jgi:hypothetical protein
MRKVDGGVEVSSCRPQIGGFSTIWCARGEEHCQLLPCSTSHADRCSADGFVDGAVPVQDEVFDDRSLGWKVEVDSAFGKDCTAAVAVSSFRSASDNSAILWSFFRGREGRGSIPADGRIRGNTLAFPLSVSFSRSNGKRLSPFRLPLPDCDFVRECQGPLPVV